jgi:hypothetical protein
MQNQNQKKERTMAGKYHVNAYNDSNTTGVYDCETLKEAKLLARDLLDNALCRNGVAMVTPHDSDDGVPAYWIHRSIRTGNRYVSGSGDLAYA